MKFIAVVLLAGTLAAHAAAVECNGVETGRGSRIYVAGNTQLSWCLPSEPGGTGRVLYVVESQTNGGSWIPEGQTYLPTWTLVRNIGETVSLRYYACNDIECTDYSPESKPVDIYVNFDADGNGRIGASDLNAWRPRITGTYFNWLRNVFGSSVINEIYVR